MLQIHVWINAMNTTRANNFDYNKDIFNCCVYINDPLIQTLVNVWTLFNFNIQNVNLAYALSSEQTEIGKLVLIWFYVCRIFQIIISTLLIPSLKVYGIPKRPFKIMIS